MDKLQIHPIKALDDNYIWMISIYNDCIVVDPGDPEPVHDWLDKNQKSLKAILITHRHWDHTDGVDELQRTYQCKVLSPLVSILNVDIEMKDQMNFSLNTYINCDYPLNIQVLSTPGHTQEHLCYLINNKNLFSGDTLFSGGCGRNFEGTIKEFYNSIQKLKLLPKDVKIYCGHEYTRNNLKFALHVEDKNQNLREYYKKLIPNNLCTLPSTIGLELEINPFLRVNSKQIIQYAERSSRKTNLKPWEIFEIIRKAKDHFT